MQHFVDSRGLKLLRVAKQRATPFEVLEGDFQQPHLLRLKISAVIVQCLDSGEERGVLERGVTRGGEEGLDLRFDSLELRRGHDGRPRAVNGRR